MDNTLFVEECGKEFEIANNNNNFQNGKSPETRPDTYTIEEAIALTECGRFHYRLLLTCGLCFLTFMSQIICIGIILPSIKCDLPTTLGEQGLLGSAGFIGVVCSSHTMGFLGDTWGRVHTLRWSLILSTIVAIISSFSPDIWTLIVTRLLMGFLVSGCQACVFSLCSEFHSNKTRARHVTLISVFLSASVIYLPIEAMIILPLNITLTIFGLLMSSWRFLLLAINISPILALILLQFTPETPKYDLIHGNHDKALETLRGMFTTNTGRPKEEYPVRNIKLEMSGANITDIHGVKDALNMIWNQTIPVFYKGRILHTLNICLILFMTYGISHGMFMWYPTILNDEIKRNGESLCKVISEVESENTDVCTGQAGTLTYWLEAFAGLAFTVVYILFSYTIGIFGKRNILIFWLIVGGCSCLAVHYVDTLPVAFLALTLICSVSNVGGIVSTIAVEFFPTNINAMAMCFVMMIGRLGAVAGNNLFGFFLFGQCDIAFWVLAAILFLNAFMSYLLPEKKREKIPNHMSREAIIIRPQESCKL